MEQGSEAGASVASQQFGEFGQDSFAELGPVIYSILVADVGSSFTRASLLERVETGFSFVAQIASTLPCSSRVMCN